MKALSFSSVIIHNLDLARVPVLPTEAYPPLVVDADAQPSLAITTQPLKVVAWRIAQVFECTRGIQLTQLAERAILDVWRKSANSVTVPYALGVPGAEGNDHTVPRYRRYAGRIKYHERPRDPDAWALDLARRADRQHQYMDLKPAAPADVDCELIGWLGAAYALSAT
jgi:hypothetical protein